MILKGISLGNKPRHTKGYNGSRDPRYQTALWRKDRKLYLQMHPLCTLCEQEGKTTPATVCDHKKPVNQGGSFWDWSNRQGLCAHHNAIKTALDNPNNQ